MKNKFLQSFIILIWIISIFFLGYFAGYGSVSGLPQRLIGQEPPERYQYIDFSKFWEALEEIEKNYIGELDYEDIIEGAITGMVASLGDPFSTYITPENINLFQEEINGTFEGIGAEISVKDGQIIIVSPLEGSPAERAGVMAGDIIKQINGENVALMTLEEVVLKIRGEKGTWVTLTIIREGEEAPLEIKIRRDEIRVKSVRYELKNNDIAYIRILRFDNTTHSLFKQAVRQLKKDKAKGVILDLRNNPGGYLEAAIRITSEFIKEGVIAIEEFKDGKQEKIYATGKGKLVDIPLVVLINQGSASGSEIVAGAIQDQKRGILIGEKTFGKGTVQELNPLTRGGALKITIAKWLTPNGINIESNGLVPDIEVEWDEGEEDIQLKRAIEEVEKIISE